jgi:hypothetical protein
MSTELTSSQIRMHAQAKRDELVALREVLVAKIAVIPDLDHVKIASLAQVQTSIEAFDAVLNSRSAEFSEENWKLWRERALPDGFS